MPEFILHHYEMSPFAEKARAMLGYSGLSWQSVITREMPPRPHLADLAGGYRRIPVAQMGADVFCDTRIIASEIAALSNKPLLALENVTPAAKEFVDHTDSEVFFACILSASGWPLMRKVINHMAWSEIALFFWDRIKMGRSMAVPVVSAKQAPVIVKGQLNRLEGMLTKDFLFGDEPCHADFSAYHGLWFIRDLGEKKTVNAYPNTTAWMNRMKAFGRGPNTALTIEQSLQVANATQPRPVADAERQDPLLGKRVQIAPSDYAQVPTEGVLVGSTPQRWILARETPATGTVHVHFPKQGFALTPR